MSETETNQPIFQISTKDHPRPFSYLKKRMKTTKFNIGELKQSFACKGWNALPSFDQHSGDETNYRITSSPPKMQQKTSKVQESCSRKKPMLVEISNIESIFKENKLKLSSDRNQPQSFHDFVQKLYKGKLNEDPHHKRRSSGSFNVLGIQELFSNSKAHSENLRYDYSFNRVPSKNLSNGTVHAKGFNQRKFQDLAQTFISNSTFDNSVDMNAEVDILIQNESSPDNKSKNKCKNGTMIRDLHKTKFKNLSEEFIHKSPCLKRKSGVFLEEFTTVANFVPKICPENDSDCDVIIQSESSPIHKSKRLFSKRPVTKCDLNENTFKNLSETFHNDSSEIVLKRKSDVLLKDTLNKANDVNSDKFLHLNGDFFKNKKCQNEYSDQDSIKIDTSVSDTDKVIDAFQHNPSENCEIEPMYITKQHGLQNEVKSAIYNNKTFIQILQSSLQEKTLLDKGSTWMLSLQWSDVSEGKELTSNNDDLFGKRVKRNIIPGGFAEQMQKLQRKERSDQVIWNHKMNEMKKKVGTNYIILILTSILQFGEIIITKCHLPDITDESIQDILRNNSLELKIIDSVMSDLRKSTISSDCAKDPKLNELIVLFKKSMFLKLQLKTKAMFVIYPPWQNISVPSLPSPVILCAYFVELLHRCPETGLDESVIHQSYSEIHYTDEVKKPENKLIYFDDLFLSDLFDKNMCISGRVQRIWENGIHSQKVQDIFKIQDYSSFSVLLQTQYGTFVTLKIGSDLPQPLSELLSEAEGGCYTFYDLKVSHRYNLRRSPQLLKFLQFIQNMNKSSTNMLSPQSFCYQFIPCSFNEMPIELSAENFPQYCGFEVKPLSFLQKNNLEGERFSCIGKVVFQDKDSFFISDESLISSRSKKYYKLKFSYTSKNRNSSEGSTILIKEAIIYGDCLCMDQFSRKYYFSNRSTDKMFFPFESRLNKIGLLSFKHVLSPLSLTSHVQEFVIVKGTVTEVDENGAVSWLECSFCYRENLLEDSNSVIYCEDCSCVVPKPILKVRMEVIVHCSYIPKAKIKIQLLSPTIKKILKISEDDFQPQCNIADVLHKSVGVLCCSVRAVEEIKGYKVFCLTEMKSY